MKSVDSEGLINNSLYLVGKLSSLEELSGGGGHKKKEGGSVKKGRRIRMPDGARNGITSDKTSMESEFGMGGGGEDEEDDTDGSLWKKSFNHAFIFDLFRAAVDGKMLNGSRKWSSTGPRDADYVLLVLNQKLKENEELMMLLDRLKSMGVPCIFFSSSDLRSPPQNGTIKFAATSSLECGGPTNGVISPQGKILKGKVFLSSPAKSPPPPPSPAPTDPLPPPVDLNNHLEDPLHPLPGSPDQTEPLQVVEPANNEAADGKASPCPVKVGKTKRKRRRKYPYVTRKPVKRKAPAIWKDLDKSEELLKEEETPPHPSDESHLVVEDPYVFTPDDDDDDDLPLELLHSPKKRKKNGLPKEPSLNRAKAAVIARVFGDISCSLSPSKESLSSGERSFSPDIAKSPKKPTQQQQQQPSRAKRRKKPLGGGRRRKVKKGGRVKVQKAINSCVQEENEEESQMISEVVEKVEEPELQEQTGEVINQTEEGGEMGKEASSSSDGNSKTPEEPEIAQEEGRPQNDTKINGALPDFLSLFDLKPKNDKTSDSDLVEPETASQSSSTATESTKCSTLLQPSLEEAQKVILSLDSAATSALATPTETVSELKLSGEELSPEVMMPPPPPPPLKESPQAGGKPGGSLPSDPMTLRRPSFYSLIAGNVRNNMENFLDGRMKDAKDSKPNRRRKRVKNGFLLHHGDNFPEDPEAPYKLHLATQILLKLNKRRAKFKPKEDKGKSLLSYLKLVPKRASRGGKGSSNVMSEDSNSSAGGSRDAQEPTSVFTGDWVQERQFICNVCGHVEGYFWDMVMHKGEIHPGVVVTHVELPNLPPEGFRVPPPVPDTSVLPPPPSCTKCQATFNTYPDLHRHIFECAGNVAWLEEPKPPKKKNSRRKKGFKRRLSNSPRKKAEGVRKVRTTSEVFKCEFCTREFKTEGWLKNHVLEVHKIMKAMK